MRAAILRKLHRARCRGAQDVAHQGHERFELRVGEQTRAAHIARVSRGVREERRDLARADLQHRLEEREDELTAIEAGEGDGCVNDGVHAPAMRIHAHAVDP